MFVYLISFLVVLLCAVCIKDSTILLHMPSFGVDSRKQPSREEFFVVRGLPACTSPVTKGTQSRLASFFLPRVAVRQTSQRVYSVFETNGIPHATKVLL